MEYKIIFQREYKIIFMQRIFNDIPFIGHYRLEDIPYSGVMCNIISYLLQSGVWSILGSTIPNIQDMSRVNPNPRYGGDEL